MSIDVVNTIYASILVVCVVIGICRGGIRSIGGLAAMVISWITSRSVSGNITLWLFNTYNVDEYISSFLTPFQDGTISNNILSGTDIVNNYTKIPLNGLPEAVANSLNVTAYDVCVTLVTILSFAILMCILGLIVNLINKSIKAVPIGKELNAVLGGFCGVIKGAILCLILYFAFVAVNSLFGANIPTNTGIINNVWQQIQAFHF